LTIGQMDYLPPVQQQPMQVPQHGAHKYHGQIAEGYDSKRVNDPKWTVEQAIIEGMISELPGGSEILDVPVGTGRFIDCYIANGHKFIGMDISGDMLVQSALKLMTEDQVAAWVQASNERNTILPLHIKDKNGLLVPGNIMQTGIPDKHVDAIVACRITRWLIGEHGPAGIVKTLKELQRIARRKIIITARVRDHKFAVSEHLIASALDGWKIARNEEGYQPQYRVMLLEAA
jgi:SAM-dependent methyltransferase